jgi:hypothetical protein
VQPAVGLPGDRVLRVADKLLPARQHFDLVEMSVDDELTGLLFPERCRSPVCKQHFRRLANTRRAAAEFDPRQIVQLGRCLFVQHVDVDADERATKKAAAVVPVFGNSSVIEPE